MNAASKASRERPPRAVVGSQISIDEEMFGAAFDGHVVRRFFSYVRPYRRRMYLALIAVLVFTALVIFPNKQMRQLGDLRAQKVADLESSTPNGSATR